MMILNIHYQLLFFFFYNGKSILWLSTSISQRVLHCNSSKTCNQPSLDKFSYPSSNYACNSYYLLKDLWLILSLFLMLFVLKHQMDTWHTKAFSEHKFRVINHIGANSSTYQDGFFPFLFDLQGYHSLCQISWKQHPVARSDVLPSAR